MANPSEIKDRITATGDTRKIAASLQLVAASKMKGFVRKAIATRQYASSLLGTLALLGENNDSLPFQTPVCQDRVHAFVLVTSDKGLCGSLNQKLIKHLFDSREWKNAPNTERLLVTIGRKGTDAARSRGIKPVLTFAGIGEDLTPLKALKIINDILSLWHNGQASKISLVSPHYVSPFVNHPTLKTYLPFETSMVKSHLSWIDPKSEAPTLSLPPLLEPTAERVTSSLAFQIIQCLFTQSFYELKAAEYSSRMVAMKKATDSATDLLSLLTLEYNKIRQAGITQQVSELASAVEATN